MTRPTLEDLQDLTQSEIDFVIEYCKDYVARRAARVSGYEPDDGYKLLKQPLIAAAIARIKQSRYEIADINAEWLLHELVDNHSLARQSNNLAASNQSLNIIAKHKFVDAYAAEKVEIVAEQGILDRLARGRKRTKIDGDTNDDEPETVSFI